MRFSIETTLVENTSESHLLADSCSDRRYASMDELLESDWEELVIQFDPENGGHVVRTACCSMGQVC
jgi:hypothetical protein